MACLQFSKRALPANALIVSFGSAIQRTKPNKIKEVSSNFESGSKIKAERGGQPQEYITYFEDWIRRSNTGFGLEGRFVNHFKSQNADNSMPRYHSQLV
jgi:hypothetical protein